MEYETRISIILQRSIARLKSLYDIMNQYYVEDSIIVHITMQSTQREVIAP